MEQVITPLTLVGTCCNKPRVLVQVAFESNSSSDRKNEGLINISKLFLTAIYGS